ncbi:PP2C family protein-serine/threonine phosphatase [Micromonospora sp. CA-240977]|uniref:PP2C family protein-serine/threonine phosphatase n=1 Tax=Micromonospora sp. CA-240977 TaxID=3239957 RepID=UPI003D8ECE2D
MPALLRDAFGVAHAEVLTAGSSPIAEHGLASAVAAALTAPVRRDGVTRFYPGRSELMDARPTLAGDVELLGWQAAVCAPLAGVPGGLLLAWTQPRVFAPEDRAHLATMIGYITRAVQRARWHDARSAVTEALQRAVGSSLPPVKGYELAARCLSADEHATIGGDWYDVIPGSPGRLALVIGDVVGHGLMAAARMGQLRSMLRAYVMDRRDPPAMLLRRLEAANHALGDPTMATAIVAFVEPTAAGGHRLRWSNAGHPPPVVIHPDGEVRVLTGHDLLLGIRCGAPRHTYTYSLPAGSTVLLHTDGLVESRGENLDDGLGRLYRCLRTTGGPEELLAAACGAQSEPRSDDIAILAVRIPG